ncbi:hypothetical protein C2S53_004281 [Perilla frutescens var. hirtella]|uniref:CASP-like protein n=1 Tax=Perilla frutescens var. hirtella TaxID=608512 RepID=A0AAD4NXX1_PERFH|nr:hypothetical protein C2S53_004281 [Perilla frutescens var. hirtella]
MALANKRNTRGCDVVLRIFALALSLTAAVVFGVDKETKTVTVTLAPTLPPTNVPLTSKWQYLSAFVFFEVADAIACGYAAISLILTLIMNGKKGITMMIIFFDLVMVALLFSGVGAAAAIGFMGYKGNSHVRWNKVCNVFEKFCAQAAAAVGISAVAATVFLLLVLRATFNLYRRH